MADGRSLFRPLRRRRRTFHRHAAHQIARPDVPSSTRDLATGIDTWQSRVLGYAEIVPEVMTGYTYVQNAMDMVTFEIEHFDRSTNEWKADDTPEMQGIERKLNLAFKAGRAAALGHLVAETYVLIERTPTNAFTTETLAPTEIRTKSKTQVEKRTLVDGTKEEWVLVPEETTIIRVFTPDPANRDHASGPHKPLLGLLETMALEERRAQANSKSVLAGNGLLLIPTEVLPDALSDSVDASETPGTGKYFEANLEEGMIAPITDAADPQGVVPLVMYGPAEALAQVRHVLLDRNDNANDARARTEGNVLRYARSIDLPEEVITGTGDTNHWTGWKVDENTWAYHLLPNGQRIASALYDGLVRAIIKNLGHDPDDYRLVPNGAAAIAKSDMSRSAHDAYVTGALTVEAYVEAIGFTPSDIKPDADELLLASIVNPGDEAYIDEGEGGTRPSRTASAESFAASRNPSVILRNASRIANAQQSKLEDLFRRTLTKVASDAALAGRKAGKAAAADPESFGKAAAGRVLFEGYEPGVYFARYAEALQTATNDELFAFLRRIATLTGSDYRTLRSVWANEFADRAAQVAARAEVAAETIAKRSFETGKPARVADNVLRELSSTANGGANKVDGGAGNTQRPTHAGNDPALKDALADSPAVEAAGGYATQYTWVTGDPANPYEPHQELEGNTWFSWEEFDQLDVADSDAWLAGTVYFPGDHDGCQCGYEVDFVPLSEAT